MSTAPQLAVGTTLTAVDDTWFSVFQSVNQPLTTQLVCGNFFIGLQGYIAVRIPLGEFGAGLCRGATIETGITNAAVTFVADGTWTAGGSVQINCMLDDSPRAGPLDSNLAWKPPGGFAPAWRVDWWGQFDARLEDTGGTPFVDFGLGNSGTFGILPLVGVREQLAGKFTVPVGPSWSVARAILELRRHGVPTGSMEVAIQTQTTDGYGHIIPDGVDLGVSAAVLNSTVPLNPASGPITFAFAPDVVLPAGNYFTVLRPSVAYVPSLVNFIVWMQQRLFFGTGGAHYHTNPVFANRFDTQLYPGHVDVHWDTLAKEQGTPVIWSPIARSPGQSISTPDLSSLVQETILNSGHETAHALCFTFRTVGETRAFRFRAHGHPSGSPPGFACQFRRRDTRGEVL